MPNRISEFSDFLREANQHGYAVDGLEVDPLLPGFKEHQHIKGHWLQRDFNAGHYSGGGFQIVWYDNKPYWMMVRGGVIENGNKNEDFIKEVLRFQRKMLRQSPKDMPVRGPIGSHKEGHFEYRNSVLGDITHFNAQESIILYDRHGTERNVYTFDYKGFLIVPK